MKFLSAITPTLKVTRVRRKAIIDEIVDKITLYETTTTYELTVPSIIRTLQLGFERFVNNFVLGGIQVYA